MNIEWLEMFYDMKHEMQQLAKRTKEIQKRKVVSCYGELPNFYVILVLQLEELRKLMSTRFL